MPIPVDSIGELKIGYTVNDQQCYNISHFGVLQGVGANAEEITWQEMLRDYFKDGWDTNGKLIREMRENMSDEALVNIVSFQWIYPVRYRASVFFPADGWPGLVEAPVSNQNTAGVFTKFGLLGNRHNVGSWHQGGMPPSLFVNGLLTAGVLTQLQVIANVWKQTIPFTIGGETTVFFPGILNKKPIPDTDPVKYEIDGITEVATVLAQDTARVMRRRTLRVGI